MVMFLAGRVGSAVGPAPSPLICSRFCSGIAPIAQRSRTQSQSQHSHGTATAQVRQRQSHAQHRQRHMHSDSTAPVA